MTLQLFVVILSGVLALACPGVLERVELRRLPYGGEMAGPRAVRLAIERCDLLGRRGTMAVDGRGMFAVYVVDCQQREHRAAQPMSARGLVADTDWAEFNHRKAVIWLR